LADVQALLGNESRQADLLIELMQGGAWNSDDFRTRIRILHAKKCKPNKI